MLRGGYYIKARKIQDSQIAHMPPHIREIWDWLIKEANHKNAVFMGREINRGELLTSYNDIREGLHWMIGWRKEMYSKWHCEKAMKVLKKADMITTMKATHRLLIKIVKYDLYQDPSNYESHKEKPTRATRKPQTTDTINKKDKNDKNILPVKTGVVFSSKDTVRKYMNSKQRHIHLIGLYWNYLDVKFDNPAQVQAQLKRNLRGATNLVGYTDKQIVDTMRLLDKESDMGRKFKWTLETIIKYL